MGVFQQAHKALSCIIDVCGQSVCRWVINVFGGSVVKRLLVSIILLSIGFLVLSQVFAADLSDRRETETESVGPGTGRRKTH